MSADILARTLDRCGIKVEILGFTTRTWKGEPVSASSGSARPNPPLRGGSPNCVTSYLGCGHAPAACAQEPGRAARRVSPKENIDGEPWRGLPLFVARPEQRRILVVICRMARRADDATLAANLGDYLERASTGDRLIERRSPVEILPPSAS